MLVYLFGVDLWFYCLSHLCFGVVNMSGEYGDRIRWRCLGTGVCVYKQFYGATIWVSRVTDSIG